MARTAGLILSSGSVMPSPRRRVAVSPRLILRANQHSAFVRRQAFAIGHRGDGVGVASNRLARVMNHRLAFEEIIDAERRREARCADRWQHMIRTRKVIADGLARIRAEKDGASVF